MLLSAPGVARVPHLLGEIDIEEVPLEEVVECQVVGLFRLGEERGGEVDAVSGEVLHVYHTDLRESGEERPAPGLFLG
jgi:hypothetical protein